MRGNTMSHIIIVALLAMGSAKADRPMPVPAPEPGPGPQPATVAPLTSGGGYVCVFNNTRPEYNEEDMSKEAWCTQREGLQGNRPPGLIHITRPLVALAVSGIPTFLNAPLALTPADLVAGNVDIAFVGVPADVSYARRGSAWGPRMVRNSGDWYPAGFTMPDQYSRVDANGWSLGGGLIMADYGDAPVNPISWYRSIGSIRSFLRDVHQAGTIPLVVGGDHAIMYPDIAAAIDHYGVNNVTVVLFDAHYDATKVTFGGEYTQANGVMNLIKEGLVTGENIIIVGTRSWAPADSDLEWIRGQRIKFYNMPTIDVYGWDQVLEWVIADVQNSTAQNVYITLDLDVFEPVYAPGTGTPEPNGLSPKQMYTAVRRLCAETNVIGAEIAEINPLLEPGCTVSGCRTSQLVNYLLRMMAVGIKMRKDGYTAPNYINATAIDGGQGQIPPNTPTMFKFSTDPTGAPTETPVAATSPAPAPSQG